MTKRAWGTVTLLSFLVSGASGAFVYWTLQKDSPKPVELQEVNAGPSEEVPPSKEPETPAPPSEVSGDSAVEGTPENPGKVSAESAAGKRNILFTFYSGSANDVFIIGDFNNWFRDPLTREGNEWTIEIPIEPGTYEYQYVVNDRKINDPYNKRVSKSGKSVLTVKPL